MTVGKVLLIILMIIILIGVFFLAGFLSICVPRAIKTRKRKRYGFDSPAKDDVLTTSVGDFESRDGSGVDRKSAIQNFDA